MRNPYASFKHLAHQKGLFFLDSSQPGQESKTSYIGHSPVDQIRGRDLNDLRKVLKKYQRRSGGLSAGGAVGYIAYDGRYCFGIYPHILTFDHSRTPTVEAAVSKQDAHVPMASKLKFHSAVGSLQYQQAVKKALQHIHDGNIYQINLARKIEIVLKDWPKHGSATAIYEALRRYSPSPFSAYYDDGGQIILSSSPERFLKLSNGIAQIKPMKGTRPRGQNKAADARFKKELLNSPKEIAELLMVTDLERNDLGRVCDYGSVKVKHMRSIEEYAHVFQATATIEGKLNKRFDGIDLIKAAFPGGSVTGCPKIEAMKIINDLEKEKRGAYTGALGYIAFDGSMDFSVLIRSLFLKRDTISFYVGSGIVADSKPAEEYKETCLKAEAIERALQEAFGG